MVASKTCAEVYRRMKQLMPNLPAAVPGSPLAGTKRKGNAPQKRKNATQVMHCCLTGFQGQNLHVIEGDPQHRLWND